MFNINFFEALVFSSVWCVVILTVFMQNKAPYGTTVFSSNVFDILFLVYDVDYLEIAE